MNDNKKHINDRNGKIINDNDYKKNQKDFIKKYGHLFPNLDLGGDKPSNQKKSPSLENKSDV